LFLTGVKASGGTIGYIDSHNRFILNGKPFFPLGLYVAQCPKGDQSVQLKEIANSPFDTLMNYAINRCAGGKVTDQQIRQHLNQLQAHDLQAIFSLVEHQGLMDIDVLAHKVATFKDHPAIISWYMNDERGPAYLPKLEARYKKIRALDPDHPVWSVHWNADWLLAEAHTTDIVGVDPYPIAHLPITHVSEMADAAARAGKPLWLVPQIFSWSDCPGDFRASTGRAPTKEEMRAMTYLATNHGARGLIYYSYFNVRDDKDYGVRWEQIKDIAQEVDDLKSVFLSTCRTNHRDVACSNTNIDFKLMREEDTYYLFAVNTKKRAITGARFRINQTKEPSMVDVMFEDNRKIPVSNGGFKDSFGPYGVHVYSWNTCT
ncbi:MAG: hypothetical protein SWE60_05790, partial [Thermodesulfobacteriota bacterium]|nr:hypothetical protein [Thermodesulfobacteriota bacterium]